MFPKWSLAGSRRICIGYVKMGVMYVYMEFGFRLLFIMVRCVINVLWKV